MFMISALPNNRRVKSLLLLWVMLLVLLSAQWAGFSHRLSHFSSVQGAVLGFTVSQNGQVSLSSLNDIELRQHSCALFDAASITDCLQHTWPLRLPKYVADHATPLFGASVWCALIALPFRSRAPPLFLKN
jgi:hypothetical protein